MRTSDCMPDTFPSHRQATRANFCADFSAMSPLLDELRQFQFHAAGAVPFLTWRLWRCRYLRRWKSFKVQFWAQLRSL